VEDAVERSKEWPEPCDVCGKDMIAGSSWFARCPACRFQASNLRPGAGSGIGGLVALRVVNARRLLDHLIALGVPRDAAILEIGCATGEFVEIAGARGFAAAGIEPDAEAHAAAAAKGLDVRKGFFPDEAPSDVAYDVLVFNHSFEHIPAPGRLVRRLES
jgi:SAM-dependent methyltransferase